jgi:hypothetical protein
MEEKVTRGKQQENEKSERKNKRRKTGMGRKNTV